MMSKLLIALIVVFIACAVAYDQLDLLLSEGDLTPFQNTAQYAAKRAPRGCICSGFLGCHGPGCMRRMRQ